MKGPPTSIVFCRFIFFTLMTLAGLHAAEGDKVIPVPQPKRPEAPKRDAKTILENTQIPEIRLAQADLRDALNFLSAMVSEANSGEALNILCMWPPDADARIPKVTLDLRNVSLMDALVFMTDLTRTRFTIERNVVVVRIP